MREKPPDCPIARTAMILGTRWTAQILREMMDHGPRRFQDLADALPGIAPNTLSSRLKMLEASEVVAREFYEDHPPRAAYTLTAKGEKMRVILNAMRMWGTRYAPR
ncbi:MAG: winged helix-turn-helix transcriptional regulator [Paracoccaceae bacterium]